MINMDMASLAPIVIVLCLGAISPGPSLVVLLRNTVEGGRRRGVFCGLGHGIGFGIYAFVAVSGIALIKESVEGASRIIEILGGIFLLFVSYSMIKEKEVEIKHHTSKRDGFKEGFLISFLNPKIFAFLIAIFSQFVQPDFSWGERGLVAIIALVIDGGWYVMVALVVSGTKLLELLQKNSGKINLVLGSLLALYGIWIIF